MYEIRMLKKMLDIHKFLWTQMSSQNWSLIFKGNAFLKKESDYANKYQSKHAYLSKQKVRYKRSYVWNGNKCLCRSFQKYSFT